MKDASQLSESYHVNPNDPNLEDVTSDFDGWIRDNGDNSANIQFGDIDGAYVISVEGHYDGDSDQELKQEYMKQMILIMVLDVLSLGITKIFLRILAEMQVET